MNLKHSSSVGRLPSESKTSVSTPRVSRREALRRGLAGAAGLALADRLGVCCWGAPEAPKLKGKAKSVIQIWLWGGPPHVDTFDPKPEAGYDYCGPLDKPIRTNVDGIVIGQLLPLLAKQADKYSLIRSYTHGDSGHETAAYRVQTGHAPGGKLVYPSLGAIVAAVKGYDAGYDGLIPPYIVLTQPQGRFSESGYLGPRFKPFATGGNPAAPEFVVEGIVAEGITYERQKARRDLLQSLNTLKQAMNGNEQLAASDKAEQRAYDLILGDEGKVFDLKQEKPETRKLYGPSKLGQSCLMARRLVEKGFSYITVNDGGWDTHRQHFEAMNSKLPALDAALATLLQDLSDRGLLETTIVWCCGEFGRTPKIDWSPTWGGGRHHYGPVMSVLVAGGGFKGGRVVGSTDRTGEKVKDRPVYPPDLLASMCMMLGIDPDGTLRHHDGVPIPVMPTKGDNELRGGLLTEIM